MHEQINTTLQMEEPLLDHPQRGLPSSNPVNMSGNSLWFPQPPTPAHSLGISHPHKCRGGEEGGHLKCPLNTTVH